MSMDDFCQCSPDEFNAIFKAWDEGNRGEWERARIVATLLLQPHCKSRLKPDKVIPLPWDAEARKQKQPKLSKEERLRRIEEKVSARRNNPSDNPGLW